MGGTDEDEMAVCDQTWSVGVLNCMFCLTSLFPSLTYNYVFLVNFGGKEGCNTMEVTSYIQSNLIVWKEKVVFSVACIYQCPMQWFDTKISQPVVVWSKQLIGG